MTVRQAGAAALLVVLALVPGTCTDRPEEDASDIGATEPPGERVHGGRVVVGHEHEPTVLNPLLVEGNLRATVMATRPVLSGAYLITPEFQYVPELIDGEAMVTGGSGDDPFTVTWRIREEARWSDGTPITADDFAFTYRTMLNEDWDIEALQRSGFAEITATEALDDKTWRATFAAPFAPYRSLFETVLPAHVLQGEDFNEVWEDGIIDPATGEAIGSGPFLFEEWERGRQLTLVRNDAYWGQSATLEGITFRYGDAATMLDQLAAGDLDLYLPQQSSPPLHERLRATPHVLVQVSPGPVWEHLDFNVDNELLAKPYVREAIARGIDREEIVDALLGGIIADPTVLQDPFYLENQAEHAPTFDEYAHDPAAAVRLLEDNGCSRNGVDSTFTCEGTPLSFRYLSTAGDDRRQELFRMIRSSLDEIGIAVVDDFRPPAEALRELLPAGDFDIANFAWVGSPEPHQAGLIFACDGALNHTGYCNEQVSALIQQGTRVVDDGERAALYHEASRLVARDLPLLPLFQHPETLAIDAKVGGVRLNATQWGPTWNTAEWYLTE